MPLATRRFKGWRGWAWLVWTAYLAVCAGYAGCREHRLAGLAEVRRAGVLRVVTRNDAYCYYTYRDAPMGLEYELAQAFAAHLGVLLELSVDRPGESLLTDLREGRADVAAAGLTATPERREMAAFSRPYLTGRQVLVQRRSQAPIRTEAELAGRTVHARRGSPPAATLARLQARGIPLQVALHDDLADEELIRRAAEGSIDATVADSHIARLHRHYYPEARLTLELTGDLPVAWAVHPRATGLRREIDRFFRRLKASGRFAEILQRTYGFVERFDYVGLRAFHRRLRTRLPRYQPLLEAAGERYGFDWRLLAAQMYQESHFRERVRSPSGAVGLMQLLPSTARALGVEDLRDPAANVETGVRHLRMLHDRLPGATPQDRLDLALAAYNVGYGHVQDARHLARRKGLDPDRWSSVARTLPLLSQERYYRRAEHGYCRGEEPVRYVAEVRTYYEILKRRAVLQAAPPPP